MGHRKPSLEPSLEPAILDPKPHFWTPKMQKCQFLVKFLKITSPSRPGFAKIPIFGEVFEIYVPPPGRIWAPRGPWGPKGPKGLFLFYREHIVSGLKLAKNQKWAEMGRRATVLSMRGWENDPTGLPEPLELFLEPKTGKKRKMSPCWGSALQGRLHWLPSVACWGQPLRACYTGLKASRCSVDLLRRCKCCRCWWPREHVAEPTPAANQCNLP